MTSQKWGNKDLTVCAQGEQWYNFTYAQRGQVLSKTFTTVQTRLDPITQQNLDYVAALPVNYEYSTTKPSSLTKITYPTTYDHVFVYDSQAGQNVYRFDTVPGYIYSYTHDSDWRMNGMTYQVNGAGNPVTQVNNVAFNAMDQMTSFRDMSLSATENRSYDHLWRLIGIGGTQTLGYSYSTTADDGKIIAKSINAGAVVENYSYDSLGRLSAAATTGPQWGLSFAYDGWGNRLQQNVTKGSAPASSLAVDPATNRVTSWSYDTNGNATSIPGVGTIVYDYANRISTVQSDSYGYDPANKRVWKNGKFILWGAEGNRLGTFELVFNQDYIGGGNYEWRLRWKGLVNEAYFGARRIGQTHDRMASQTAHFPYGEEPTSTGPGDKFASYYRDSTGLDYADQRYYHAASGRFLTADPAASSSAVDNPASWNKYGYCWSDPVNYVDPDGREPVFLGFLYFVRNDGAPIAVPIYAATFQVFGFGFQVLLAGLAILGPSPQWQTQAQIDSKVNARDAQIADQQRKSANDDRRNPGFLRVIRDCYGRQKGAVSRFITYEILDENQQPWTGGDIAVTESNYLRTGQLTASGATWSTANEEVKRDSAGRLVFTDELSIGTGPTTEMYQQFDATVPRGINGGQVGVPLVIIGMNGQHYGTLGVYMTRDYIRINGNDGKKDGGLNYCN